MALAQINNFGMVLGGGMDADLLDQWNNVQHINLDTSAVDVILRQYYILY